MSKFFTGIGSRETPLEVKEEIAIKICPILIKKGYILRSGGADGADMAFENGYRAYSGEAEIFLPWKNFNDNKSEYYKISNDAMKIAEKYHPAWKHLSQGAKLLHSRNVYQILGYDLCSPSSFVICWTKDGAEELSQISKNTGGTGQALRIAIDHNVRIYNLYNYTNGLYTINNFIDILEKEID